MKSVCCLIVLCALLIICGCGDPLTQWRRGLHDTLEALSRLKVVDGEPDQYKDFYGLCDVLTQYVYGTGYGVDLLKDTILTADALTVRAACAEVLGRLELRAAARVCVIALNDQELFVRERASKALHRITNADLGMDPKVWSDWLDKNSGEM